MSYKRQITYILIQQGKDQAQISTGEGKCQSIVRLLQWWFSIKADVTFK